MRKARSIVVGERIRLVRPTASMTDEFVAAVARSRGLHAPWVSPPADAGAYRSYLDRMRRDDQFGFVLRRTDDDALAGVINVNNIVYGGFWSAYLGYYAFVGAAGQGLMSDGLRLVVDHAFQRLGLHRLEANIQPGNVPSIALVRRTGFRLEGLSPRYLFIDGAWRDHERWAITNEEQVDGPGR